MRNVIGATLPITRTFALVAALIVTTQLALAQTASIKMGNNGVFSPKGGISFSFSNAPGNPGEFVVLVPKGQALEDSKGLKGLWLQGRTDGENTLVGLDAGEYEARLYSSGKELLARAPFMVGEPAPEAITTDTSTVEPPPDDPIPAPTSTANEPTGGPAIKTTQPIYASREGVTVAFSNAPGNPNEFVVLVPKEQADENSKGLKGLWLRGRTDGENTLVGLPPGEYEARLYGAGNELMARYPFKVE